MLKTISFILVLFFVSGTNAALAQTEKNDSERLVAAILANSQAVSDLETLTDVYGGRPAGSGANEGAVKWAVETMKKAGLNAWAEPFTIEDLWLPGTSDISITSNDIAEFLPYSPRVVTKPYSANTDKKGLNAPILYVGEGKAEDFAKLGSAVKGALLLVKTPVLSDELGLGGLFAEYGDAVPIEKQALEHGAAGMIFMSSRPKNLLFRHNATFDAQNKLPLVVMEREGAQRLIRLLDNGHKLSANLNIQSQHISNFVAYNPVGEIKGSERPDEIIVIGAHIDSHDLGTGALDNGANVTMLMDVGRQIMALGIKPKRTIRFVMFNSEELGLLGSWGYVKTHMGEMDKHIMATSIDIGTGKLKGFFTGGRNELNLPLDEALKAVAQFGPFTYSNVPLVGTDNYDFMMEGVPNLVGDQLDANYASNYHARSDTFDKVDQHQMVENEAIAAALVLGFANSTWVGGRDSKSEIEKLIATTDLEEQMRSQGVWQAWIDGKRGGTEAP